MRLKKLCGQVLFLLLLLANLAQAGTIDCYIGTKKAASISAENFDGTLWLSLAETVKALDLKIERVGDETILSGGNVRIKLIEKSIAAWIGNRLLSLYEAPLNANGTVWLDERSANALFRGIFGGNRQVTFKNPSGVGTAQKKPDNIKPGEEILFNVPNKVRSEKPAAQTQPKTPTPMPTPTPTQVNAPKAIPTTGKLVVIDPGHGGQDPGAVANGVKEKDINLSIGLKIEQALRGKGIKTDMTRKTDIYLPLAARTEFANKLNAAVFISVHANAMPKGKSAAGFEIYIMALPTDRDALELAKFENREIIDGKINIEASDKKTQLFVQSLGEENKKKVSIILGDMKQNDKITRSTRLTEELFQSGNHSGIPMRRVAQAPFFVLRGTDNVTSVLLETGFLTDNREARLLAHPGYQQKIADAMAAGVIAYIKGGI